MERFEAYGWRVRYLGEVANDVDVLEAAVREALDPRPTGPTPSRTCSSCAATSAGPRRKLTDTAEAHGNPFGADEIRVTKGLLGLPPDQTFWVPDEVREFYGHERPRGRGPRASGRSASTAWDGDRAAWDAAQAGHGCPAGPTTCRSSRRAPAGHAARHQPVHQRHRAALPGLMAGSADLTGNNGVLVKGPTNRRRAHRAGASCTTASASTAWARP